MLTKLKKIKAKIDYILDKPAEEIFTPKVLMCMALAIPVILDVEFILVVLILRLLAK